VSRVYPHITQTLCVSRGILYLAKKTMDQLRIKDGRLINDRPVGETGIAEMARLRKTVRRAEKISMIADGVALGDMKGKMIGM